MVHTCASGFGKNGRQVDALKVDLPASKGIDKESLLVFKTHADSVRNRLDLIKFPEAEPLLAQIKLPLPTID